MRAIVMFPLIIRPSVWPSVDLATWSAAMLPPAPTLFSTITVCPRALPKGSASARAVKSGLEPAGKPTTSLRVWLGQSAAACVKGLPRPKARAAALNKDRRERGDKVCKRIKGSPEHLNSCHFSAVPTRLVSAPVCEQGLPKKYPAMAGYGAGLRALFRRTRQALSSFSSWPRLRSGGCVQRSHRIRPPSRAASCHPSRCRSL